MDHFARLFLFIADDLDPLIEGRLSPLVFAMRATVARESPASRAIFQKG
jgi:hypothetical protein